MKAQFEAEICTIVSMSQYVRYNYRSRRVRAPLSTDSQPQLVHNELNAYVKTDRAR